MKKSISFRVHIKNEDLESILYGAFEGTGYWAKDKEDEEGYSKGFALLNYESYMKDFLNGDLEIHFEDSEEENKSYVLNIRKIRRGFTVLAKKYPHIIANILNDKADMNTADALVQCAVFGDILYS